MLASYAADIRSAGAVAVRMVATSATRDAANAADFTRGVQRIVGVLPEVISGREEAGLSFAGATAELAAEAAAGAGPRPEPPFLVVDIGGGSTEFVLGKAGSDAQRGGDLAAISVDIGCVRLTERHLHGDPPALAEVAGASADIDRALDEVATTIAVQDARTLVGLAGSVTSITAIALGLDTYDPSRTHHARIPAATVDAVTRQLLGQTRRERAAIGSLHPGRVDVIAAGALVLDQVMQRFGFAEVVTSEHDILDGIAWSIADAG